MDSFVPPIDTNLITLSRHVINEQSMHKEASGDLSLLLVSLQVACKFISSQVRRAGLANLTGLAGGSQGINVQGETVKKLDVIANDIFVNCLTSSGRVSVMVSEEVPNTILVSDASASDPTADHKRKYCVVFDPLDGSSNIDAGVSIGSIFGIYHSKTGTEADVLGPGSQLVAAGYAMYGSFTALVLSTGQGAHGYTLDPSIGEFILTQPNICIPSRGKIYSVNEGNAHFWDVGTRSYFESIKKGPTPYSARYVGSMVADVHRTLLYGGIFAYPSDSKSPHGKLRLLYEAFPMAFLVEQAGGKASTGTMRILDIVPTGIHQRSPIILGSAEDVQDFEKTYKSMNASGLKN